MLIYGKNHQNIVKNYSPIKLMIKKKKRIHLPMKRAGVQSLAQAVSTCHRAAKTVSQLLNLPSPTTGATSLELMLRNKSSLCNEKPGHHR